MRLPQRSHLTPGKAAFAPWLLRFLSREWSMCTRPAVLQGVLTCLAGRLLADTYVCARDLLREVEYSLASLARAHLQQERPELHTHQVRAICCALEFVLPCCVHSLML